MSCKNNNFLWFLFFINNENKEVKNIMENKDIMLMYDNFYIKLEILGDIYME